MAVNLVPILLEIAQRITHRVGIFARQDRARIIFPLGNLQQTLPAGILGTLCIGTLGDARIQIIGLHARIETADDIDRCRIGAAANTLRPFVMHRTCRVKIVQPGRDGGKIGTIAALITHRPKDHRRAVLVALGHADGPIQEGGMPIGGRSQRTAQAMFLNIGFIHHIETQRITQFIPTRHIGIVGRAHGVDISAFHQQYILQHPLLGHHTCRQRIMFVAVHTTKTDWLSVDEHLPVLHLDRAEAKPLRGALHHLALRILQREVQRIEVRRFGRPTLRSGDRSRHASQLTRAALREPLIHIGRLMIQVQHRLNRNCKLLDLLTTGIRKRSLEGISLAALAPIDGKFGIDLQRKVAIRRIGQCPHGIIGQAHIARMVEQHIAVDSAKTPEILILQIRAIAIPIDLHGDSILPRLQVGRDVELRRLHAPLRVADLLAIDPDIEGTHHPLEAQEGLPVRPPRG